MKSDELGIWMGLIKIILDRPMAPHLLENPGNWDDIKKMEATKEWKVKFMCMKIVSRMNYHASNLTTNNREILQIKGEYIEKYIIFFFESAYKLMVAAKSSYVSPETLAYAIKTIQYATMVDDKFDYFHPHLIGIIFEHLLPLMAMN